MMMVVAMSAGLAWLSTNGILAVLMMYLGARLGRPKPTNRGEMCVDGGRIGFG